MIGTHMYILHLSYITTIKTSIACSKHGIGVGIQGRGITGTYIFFAKIDTAKASKMAAKFLL